MVPTSASRGTLYAIGHKYMKYIINKSIVILICFILFCQCYSKNKDPKGMYKDEMIDNKLQISSEDKKIIENAFQAKLPKSTSNLKYMIASKFFFNIIGKFECDETEIKEFIISNDFNSVVSEDILNYFISTEYDGWWKPRILNNVLSFRKDWEYRNDINTLIKAKCLIVTGNEDDKQNIIIYFDILNQF